MQFGKIKFLVIGKKNQFGVNLLLDCISFKIAIYTFLIRLLKSLLHYFDLRNLRI